MATGQIVSPEHCTTHYSKDYKKKGTTDTFSDVKTFEAKMRSTESTSNSRNAMRASGCDCGMMPEEGY